MEHASGLVISLPLPIQTLSFRQHIFHSNFPESIELAGRLIITEANMQNMSHSNMFFLPEYVPSHKASYYSENTITLDITRAQDSLSKSVRKSSTHTMIEGNREKERRAMEKNLVMVKKEWMKVKEEMGYAKECGEYLCETLIETDKKLEEMLAELDRANKYVRDLVASSNVNF